MIDWLRVRELREEIGEEDFADVVALFLEEVDEVIDRIQVTHDISQLGADFHFLKGSALNLGFQSFASICAVEENRASKGELTEIDTTSAINSYQASRLEFTSWMEN